MAGVTDAPFRALCMRLGAGMAVSEMLTADIRLWNTAKSRRRMAFAQETYPRSVQIAGACPTQLARAAQANVDAGAEIIDINMGCPAKKVCKVAAGSALLKDERLVAQILEAVVHAVSVPVTLKIRTGWDTENRNAVTIARIAQESGIAALAVHGRTRACAFKGHAEYDTIRDVKRAVSIPVIANGDISSGGDAAHVLQTTGADGVMIGRAAQGNPWIFREIDNYIRRKTTIAPPPLTQVRDTLLEHLQELHDFYDEFIGVRIARKHLSWYCKHRPGAEQFWQRVNRVEDPVQQLSLTRAYFDELIGLSDTS
ncbi:MAG: tRNA-dihydrouridine synthase B, partial [Gammaproteobacteria bacterium]